MKQILKFTIKNNDHLLITHYVHDFETFKKIIHEYLIKRQLHELIDFEIDNILIEYTNVKTNNHKHDKLLIDIDDLTIKMLFDDYKNVYDTQRLNFTYKHKTKRLYNYHIIRLTIHQLST